MKKVLIQVNTEFHYMVALSLIDKYYSGPEFDVHFIVFIHPVFGSRLSTVKLDDRYTYRRVRYDHNSKDVFPDVLELKKFIEGNQFYHFISFLYSDPLFVYLTDYFKGKGTTTFLAPDGMGAYVKFQSKNYRSRLMNSLHSYSFLKAHGFNFRRLWFTNWDFGKNGYYDYIYAYSSTLPYLKGKNIIEVDYTFSPQSLESLKRTFDVSFDGLPLNDAILLINERHKVVNYEKKLIDTIRATKPGRPILFKKHPNQAQENIEYLKAYPDVIVLDKVFPVELLIASLSNSVIISSYSNCMLYHNPTCKYFWTYPVLEKSGEFNKPITRYNPKQYIKVVDNFEELKAEV